MSSPYKTIDERAVYHPISPTITLLIRVLGVTVGLVLLAASIMCFARGLVDNSAFLLAANNLITVLICSIVGFLYRKGDLDVDKFWFVIAVCLIAIFKAIVSSIAVFNESIVGPVTTTPAPTTHIMTTGTATRFVTWLTLVPPTKPA